MVALFISTINQLIIQTNIKINKKLPCPSSIRLNEKSQSTKTARINRNSTEFDYPIKLSLLLQTKSSFYLFIKASIKTVRKCISAIQPLQFKRTLNLNPCSL